MEQDSLDQKKAASWRFYVDAAGRRVVCIIDQKKAAARRFYIEAASRRFYVVISSLIQNCDRRRFGGIEVAGVEPSFPMQRAEAI